jgi:hypothetical protein
VAEQVGPEVFWDPAHRAIFEALIADEDLSIPPQSMDPVAAKRLEALLSASPEEVSHGEQMLNAALSELQVRNARERERRELDERLLATQEPEERDRIILEKARSDSESKAGEHTGAESRRGFATDWGHLARKARTMGRDQT